MGKVIVGKLVRRGAADSIEELEIVGNPRRISGGVVVTVRRTPGQYLAGMKWEEPVCNLYDPETGKQARL